MSEQLLNVTDLQIDYKTDLETVHAVNGISFSLNIQYYLEAKVYVKPN